MAANANANEVNKDGERELNERNKDDEPDLNMDNDMDTELTNDKIKKCTKCRRFTYVTLTLMDQDAQWRGSEMRKSRKKIDKCWRRGEKC